MKRALALAVSLLAAGACSERRTVDLTFGGGTRTPIGFRCRDDSGRFLAARAVDRDRTLRFSLLIDFIDLGGLPTCRLGDIAAFCAEHSCVPLSEPARVCYDLEQQLAGTDENAVTAIGALLRGLDGRPVTADAPHDPVIVRAVASAQSCAELAGVTTVDPARLIGCAISCPVQLDGVEGEILLDLPTLSDTCAAGVTACAAGMLAQ